MRRPAAPTGDVLDLDYGSADGPSVGDGQGDATNEVAQHPAGADEAQRAARSHQTSNDLLGPARKLPAAYDTDDLDRTTQAASTSLQPATSNGFHAPDQTDSAGGVDVHAVAGPSSLRETAPFGSGLLAHIGSAHADAGAAEGPRSWADAALQHPPPPSYPPPALPHADVQPFPTHEGYGPNLPQLHSTGFEPNQQARHGAAYFGVPAHHAVPSGRSDPYSQPGQQLYAPYDLPYDPRMPMPYDPYAMGALPPQFPLPPLLPTPPYPGGYAGQSMDVSSLGYQAAHLNRKQRKKMLKNQKKKDKKLQALSATAMPFEPSPSSAELTWTEDGKPQALAMISELRSRGVLPARLTEYGVPLALIEACCSELGVAVQGAGASEQAEVQSAKESKEGEAQPANTTIQTTKAEDELLSKKDSGVPLTPLEELRRKVLASRLAKAAAASRAASQDAAESAPPGTESSGSQSTPFDRVATSGESEALLSQIGATLRGLLQPAQTPSDPASSTSRKRPYRDVDAVDQGQLAKSGDLAASEAASTPLPSRRQRVSYADNFSRAVAPSGEVDLNTPLPELPDFGRSPQPPASRRRPAAADFDMDEYAPPLVRADRFLDVPSGLNTVVDLSDDEADEEELAAFDSADGWNEVRLAVDPRRVVELRQRTATEHYDSFCEFSGLPASRRAGTPHRESTSREEGAEQEGGVQRDTPAATAVSVPSPGGPSTPSREDLLRKELEIKQLMRKIELMEQRKKHQEAAAAQTSPQEAVKNGDVPSSAIDAEDPEVQTQSFKVGPSAASAKDAQAGGVTSSVRLDPALQKQREKLLALLASKRQTVEAGTDTKEVTNDEGSKTVDAQAEDAVVSRTEVEAGRSRYVPLVPKLFSSVASTVRAYLPSLAWRAAPGEGGAALKWCPREADGGRCGDVHCRQRHAADLDPDLEPEHFE